MPFARIPAASVPARLSTARAGLGCAFIASALLLAGCSSSQSDVGAAGSSRLIGSERQAAVQPPPSAYEADGPGPQPIYRGGRDPVTGRAQEWAPAAPPQSPAIERTAMAPLPPQPVYQPPSPAYGSAAPPRAVGARAAAGTMVEVRHGDTLYRIARAHNVSVPSLMQANGLASESIRPGQRLVIPAS